MSPPSIDRKAARIARELPPHLQELAENVLTDPELAPKDRCILLKDLRRSHPEEAWSAEDEDSSSDLARQQDLYPEAFDPQESARYAAKAEDIRESQRLALRLCAFPEAFGFPAEKDSDVPRPEKKSPPVIPRNGRSHHMRLLAARNRVAESQFDPVEILLTGTQRMAKAVLRRLRGQTPGQFLASLEC